MQEPDEIRPPLESPRLRVLAEQLAADEAGAVQAFLAERAEAGAPLIEPLEDDPERWLVTFVYAGGEAVTGVRLFGGPEDEGDPEFRLLADSGLWFASFRVRNDLRALYKLAVRRRREAGEEYTSVELDPLNQRVFETSFPNSAGWSDSVLELPQAAPQPFVAPREGVPPGDVHELMHHSELTGDDRRVWIYTPPGYSPESGPYPLLLLLDGQAYVACGSAPTTLDNLIHEGLIPPTVAVMVSIPEGAPEARLEQYACSPEYNEFLAKELIPLIRAEVNVSVDPRWNAVGGSSLGGLQAAYAGLELYFIFGNVLSQSGSYWWRPPEYPEHEWLARQFTLAPLRPLRFFLTVGLLETDTTPGNGPTQVMVNRHMRNVLEARGYPVTYRELNEGHNFLSWRGSLAEGLLNLFGIEGAVAEAGSELGSRTLPPTEMEAAR